MRGTDHGDGTSVLLSSPHLIGGTTLPEGEENMARERTRLMVEIALVAALGAALHLAGITLPINIAGGEISLAMLPIVVFAVRRGWGPGLIAGTLVGLLALLYKPFIVHPAQLVLDYPLAFAAVGLAGVVRPLHTKAALKCAWLSVAVIAATGGLIGGTARLGAHFLSGIIFFASSAPAGQPVWLYSLLYNGAYMLPSTIACAALAAVVVPALDRASSPNRLAEA